MRLQSGLLGLFLCTFLFASQPPNLSTSFWYSAGPDKPFEQISGEDLEAYFEKDYDSSRMWEQVNEHFQTTVSGRTIYSLIGLEAHIQDATEEKILTSIRSRFRDVETEVVFRASAIEVGVDYLRFRRESTRKRRDTLREGASDISRLAREGRWDFASYWGVSLPSFDKLIEVGVDLNRAKINGSPLESLKAKKAAMEKEIEDEVVSRWRHRQQLSQIIERNHYNLISLHLSLLDNPHIDSVDLQVRVQKNSPLSETRSLRLVASNSLARELFNVDSGPMSYLVSYKGLLLLYARAFDRQPHESSKLVSTQY